LDKRTKWRNIDIRFGTRNIRSLYRAVSLITVSRELSRYRIDIVGVQVVRWDGSGTVPAREYTFSMERGMRTMNWVQDFVHKRIISAVKRVAFVLVSYYCSECSCTNRG
jgi:hypothetical protein